MLCPSRSRTSRRFDSLTFYQDKHRSIPCLLGGVYLESRSGSLNVSLFRESSGDNRSKALVHAESCISLSVILFTFSCCSYRYLCPLLWLIRNKSLEQSPRALQPTSIVTQVGRNFIVRCARPHLTVKRKTTRTLPLS
jgi:hypothetical protein